MAITVAFTAVSAGAAEIRFRPECRPQSRVVALGDVAEVLAADAAKAQTLQAMELFPAPPPGQRKFVQVREMQDLLLLRGLNLVEHQLSGSSQVTVIGPEVAGRVAATSSVPAADQKSAEAIVRQAILRYLRELGDEPWEVRFELSAEQAGLVMDSRGHVLIGGGMPPWTGPQRFELTVSAKEGVQRSTLDVEVKLPPPVVVATVPIPRGATIHADYVQYQRLEQFPVGTPFLSLEEVLGKETMRPIPAGTAIQTNHVRPALLVRRGDTISICAHTEGIRVTTQARATEEGAAGDMIAVESLQGRQVYFARVSGIKQAEVACGSPIGTHRSNRPARRHAENVPQWSIDRSANQSLGHEKRLHTGRSVHSTGAYGGRSHSPRDQAVLARPESKIHPGLHGNPSWP
jgi:flagella basal body P-ring formation protein FlgA